MSPRILPRILIIDDLFGRVHGDRRNEERANLCGQYLLHDVTGDEIGKGEPQEIVQPIAEVVFCRGQHPACSTLGDTVENDLEATLNFVRSGWSGCPADQPPWSMVLLDLCFYTGKVTPASSSRRSLGMPAGRPTDDDPPTYFGLRLLRAFHAEFPELPVVILSSKPREEVSKEFSYHGALAFLPREQSSSPELLEEYLFRHGLIPDPTEEVVGYSKPVLLALRTARAAAATSQNVLLRGESGTGKELFARYIHRHRTGADRSPFVAINSASLTPELYTSELFGIEERIATGVRRRQGKILDANGGDLFFDEIADMVPQAQAGILRVLEDRSVTPVGSNQSQLADVRFLSATNVDIEWRTANGTFRGDLLYRLRQGGTILLPPLRYRTQDIPLLVRRFIEDARTENPRALDRVVEGDALDKLKSYDWPGNIRELRDCIFQAVLSYPDVEHLVPDHIKLPAPPKVDPGPSRTIQVIDPKPEAANSPDTLTRALDSMDFKSLDPLVYAGKLGQFEVAWARFMGRLLKAALEATRKRTPQNPEGEVLPVTAVKFLTGDKDLKAWQVYDVIKRATNLSSDVKKELLNDPVLRQVIERAENSRNGK